jgi:hypothetical protein
MIAWRKAIYLFIALALVLGLVPSAVMAMSPRQLPAAPGYVVDWNVFSTQQTWTIPLAADANGWAGCHQRDGESIHPGFS